ncbi:glycosyltransferase 87 family protein [Streptomyces sp. NPDC007883]|uniref:glycosyltransferase 87 family protein n=1 Tax=Streptomyces sp. NPDC007883 TaxID=3155116 RepID=UPI0033E53355
MTTQQAPSLVPAGRRVAALPLLALCGTWAATRLGTASLLVTDDIGIGGVSTEVYVLYARWYDQLLGGTFPPDDPTWQYPPGAGAVILAPALLPWLTYFQAFAALALLADAVVTVALARAGGVGGGGVWMWTGGLPLLLHIPLARYDVLVTALAVSALLAVNRRPRLGGALAGLGAAVKLWPALTLLGTPRGRTTRLAWVSAAAAALGAVAALALGLDRPLGFLRQQGDRGVQVESLGGSALALVRLLGGGGRVEYRYGAFEFTGPYVTLVARASLLLTAAAFLLVLLWRLRARRRSEATPFDAALCAVLLFTVTSRVISPQYLIWLLGLAAVCLTSRHTSQRTVALLLLPATALSALAYPVLYQDVIDVTPLGSGVVLVRNGLLLTAAVLSARRLWAATR